MEMIYLGSENAKKYYASELQMFERTEIHAQ